MLQEWKAMEKPEEEEIRARLAAAKEKLAKQQLLIKEQKIPVLVLMEGWGTAGKGSVIGQVIQNIDPRFFKVESMGEKSEEECRKPFLYRYFRRIPEEGKFVFLDSGWMDEIVKDELHGKLSDEDYAKRIESVRRFERQLTDNGYLVMKFFLHIPEKEQAKRIEHLEHEKDTVWRVSKNDLWQNRHYEKCEEAFSSYMKNTNMPSAPWYIIDAKSRKWTELQVLETLTQGIEIALSNQKLAVPLLQNVFPLVRMPLLAEVPLDKEIEADEYRKELKELQKQFMPEDTKAGLIQSFLDNFKGRTGSVSCTIVFTGKKCRSSLPMRAGMQREKAATSSGSQEHLTRAVTKFIRSQARNLMRKQDITCGVSGRDCRKQDISLFLTAPGMEE